MADDTPLHDGASEGTMARGDTTNLCCGVDVGGGLLSVVDDTDEREVNASMADTIGGGCDGDGTFLSSIDVAKGLGTVVH